MQEPGVNLGITLNRVVWEQWTYSAWRIICVAISRRVIREFGARSLVHNETDRIHIFAWLPKPTSWASPIAIHSASRCPASIQGLRRMLSLKHGVISKIQRRKGIAESTGHRHVIRAARRQFLIIRKDIASRGCRDHATCKSLITAGWKSWLYFEFGGSCQYPERADRGN